MKKAEIVKGTWYANDKGSFRKVTGTNDDDKRAFLLYRWQVEMDTVGYVQVNTRKTGLALKFDSMYHDITAVDGVSHRSRRTWHTTRTSFASWAKRTATSEESAECEVAFVKGREA